MAVCFTVNKNKSVYKNNQLKLCVVIPFRPHTHFRREKSVCPVCGREFESIVKFNQVNTESGKFCSIKCRWKANQKSLSTLITNEEFKCFLELHKERVRKACNMAPKLHYKDPNAKWEDCFQECCIALFLLMARCRREGRDYNNISEGSVFFQLKKAIQMSKVERRRWYNHSEELCYDEYNKANGIDLDLSYESDTSTTVDMTSMLEKVIELAKEYPDVRMVLEKAYLYRQPKDEQACKYIKNKYGIKTNGQYVWHLAKGVEHIYYNDKENFDTFIDINNLSTRYAFNCTDPKVRPVGFDKWDIERILSWYTGIKTCSYCGKKFKANAKQKSEDVVYCTKECAKEANRIYRNAWKRAKRARLKELQCK